MEDQSQNEGFDLVGLGKVAKAIPPEVYIKTTKTLLKTFNQIVSPITETTSGIGRYIKQKFDNMVAAEKAVATFTIQNAVEIANRKAKKIDAEIRPSKHIKSFVSSLEEASKETDPVLHEMWEDILANQLLDSEFHPHFVKILAHFSSAEANLLLSLNSLESIGNSHSAYISYDPDSFTHFVKQIPSDIILPWTYSCDLLLEFGFANTVGPTDDFYKREDFVTILYRTKAGTQFLKAVSA